MITYSQIIKQSLLVFGIICIILLIFTTFWATAPTFVSISPISGPIGTKVIITGPGFVDSNGESCQDSIAGPYCTTKGIGGNDIYFDDVLISKVYKTGKNQVEFIVPATIRKVHSFDKICPDAGYCNLVPTQVIPGTYDVTVVNKNSGNYKKETRFAHFTVTGVSDPLSNSPSILGPVVEK